MSADPVIRGVDQCPDPETLAAFLDNRLAESDREAVAAHLTACETCYAVFLESLQTKPVAAIAPATNQVIGRRKVIVAMTAGLAAAAALLLAVVVPWRQQAGVEESSIQALVVAMGSERTIEPRLSGGFAYGPVRGPVRAGEPATDTLPPDVRIAAAVIEKQALVDRAPRTLQALGIAYLVRGDAARAIPVLEEAANAASADAGVLSDLAAAYLVRSTREERPEDIAKALALADRSVKADTRPAEAWFNRALALERLSLIDQARQAWEDYLKVDSTSGWADEARAHLAALSGRPRARAFEEIRREFGDAAARSTPDALQALATRAPDTARQWLQAQLLEAWPAAVLDARIAEADKTLADARVAARAITVATGERFMEDIVSSAGRASQSEPARTALANAHRQFQLATVDYYSDRISDAVAGFARAHGTLAAAESPLSVWTQLYSGIGHYYKAAFTDALRELDAVSLIANQRGYHRVEGLSRRVAGLVKVVQGDFAGGLETYRLAIAAFQRARDTDSEAAMRAVAAEALGFLGEPDLAWAEVAAGLTRLPTVADFRARQNILTQAALSALAAGLPETAWHFQNALLDNARQWNRPLAMFDGHLYLSEILKQLHDAPAARAELNRAGQLLQTLGDRQLVVRNEARLQLAEGEMALNDRTPAAVTMLSTALASFEKLDRHWPTARVLLARGRAHLGQGDLNRAESDFTAGIDLFERRRASIANEALRSASFEQPWDLYTEMIRLQIDHRQQPDRALALAERSRARTLLESIAEDEPLNPVSPMAARATLPTSSAVLYYVELGDRILVWVLSRSRADFVQIKGAADVGHLLNQFKAETAARQTVGRDAISLTRLYDLLIRPLRDHVPAGANLVIVPDGALHAVPFAALVRREDRRYLVEDYSIQYAPSFTMLLEASSGRSSFADSPSALVVGNPTVGDDDAILAPDLPEAVAEAGEVAGCYRKSKVLIGAAATKAAFLESLPRYDVIHFAGHAVANDRQPGLSRLLLAGDDSASRSLFAREIASHKLVTTRLVVLGACRTSSGRVRRGEGVFSLARPFLAAGAPLVLAALWDVNDSASRRLLVAFHRALPMSPSPAEALRRAQLELMGDTNPLLQGPSGWAGFTLIGGVTDTATVATSARDTGDKR